MPETILTGIATMAGATITAFAALLGVDRFRNRNGKGNQNAELIVALQNLTKTTQEVRYVRLDREDREVLLATANTLLRVADHLDSFAKNNHEEHEYLREHLPK